MNKLIYRIDRAVSERVLNKMDAMIDRRICGQSLVPYVPSIFRDDKAGVQAAIRGLVESGEYPAALF